MKTFPLFWLALPSLALLAACNPGPKSGRGFVLPEGDAVRPMTMPNVNETITVAQLRDIVTFLQPHYRPLPPLDVRYSR